MHLTPEDRVARGKAARNKRPRGRPTASGSRRPIGRIPSRCSRSRRRPGCPSWCRSATGGCSSRRSRFYRGAALIMAADLAATPRSGLNAQLCGDAHLSNFGVFASPERQLIFDINDFDETLPGPWEWDVKRLAASFEIAGRDAAFAPADRREIVAGRRRASTASDAPVRRHAATWTSGTRTSRSTRAARARCAAELTRSEREARARRVAKARTRDSMQAFSKLTARGRRRAPDHRRPSADRAARGTAAAGHGARRDRGARCAS